MQKERNYLATTNRVTINKNPFGPRLGQIDIRSISIQVTRYVTDVDGQLIAKATLPANMQVKYPVFMFGAFDMVSGYRAGSNICPAQNGAVYLTSFVNGFPSTSFSIVGVTGLNEIQSRLNLGDIVHVFTDSLNAPNYFVWVVQSSNALSGLGSIMDNLRTSQNDNRLGRLKFFEVILITDNFAQWRNAMNFTVFDNLGNYSNDSLSPLMFRTPTSELDNLIRMDVQYMTDQYVGINTYIEFAVDSMTFDFNIKGNE